MTDAVIHEPPSPSSKVAVPLLQSTSGRSRAGRPQQIRDVFAELRRAVGDIAPAGELLRAASELVGLFHADEFEEASCSMHLGGLPFECWSVDRVMGHATWRVVGFESDLFDEVRNEERDPVSIRNEQILEITRLAA